MSSRPAARRLGAGLVEAGIAMLLVMVVASAVTVVATRAVGRDVEARLTGQASAALDRLLATVADAGYQAVLDGTAVPDCGPSGGTCADMAGHGTVDVAIDVTPGFAARGGGQVAWLDVTATLDVPGSTVAVTRTVRIDAPAGGYATGGDAVVRVTFDGPAPATVVLVDADTNAAVASAAVSSGVAAVPVAVAGCTRLDPCRVALSTAEPYFDAAGVGMTAAAVDRTVVATGDAVTDVTVATTATGTFTADLEAVNPTTGTEPADDPGSICLWATLPGDVAVPVCNDDDADRITAARGPYDPARPDLQVAIPAGVPVAVTADHPDGTCPPVAGHVGHRTGGWVDVAVCTSWTWGPPTSWSDPDTAVVPFSSAVAVADPADPPVYVATWDGPAARPATGYANQPAWAKPREAPACADDGTCTIPDGVPEQTACPGQHCLSVATLPPALVGPRLGSYNVAGVKLSEADHKGFDLDVVDADGDNVTVVLSEQVTGGTLRLGSQAGPVLNEGDTIGVASAGSGTFTLDFERPGGGSQLHRFTVTLDDGQEQVDVPVAIWQGQWTWTVAPDPGGVVAAQGTGGHVVDFVAVGPDGEVAPQGQVDVAVVDDSGQPLSTVTVTTDTAGQGSVTIDLTGPDVPAADDYTIEFSPADSAIGGAGVPAATAPLTVLPTAGDLTADLPTEIVQGTDATLTATATDLAGGGIDGAVVTWTAAGPGADPGGVALDPRCVTGPSGTCTVTLSAAAAATAGTWQVQADSGTFTATGDVTLVAVPATVVADDATVADGDTVDVSVDVVDQAGTVIPGATVDVAAPAGFDIAQAAGVVQLTAAGAAVGDHTVTFTSPADPAGRWPAVATDVVVTVAPAPADATFDVASEPVLLPRVGTTTLTVTVTDAGGIPVPDTAVTFEVDSARVAVDARAVTGDDGTATVELVTSGGSGLATLTATAGTATTTVDLQVTRFE